MSRLPPRNTLENTCTHLTEENVSECAKCITTHAPFRNGWKGTAPVPVRKRVPKSPRRQPHEAASSFSRGTLRARRFSAEARAFSGGIEVLRFGDGEVFLRGDVCRGESCEGSVYAVSHVWARGCTRMRRRGFFLRKNSFAVSLTATRSSSCAPKSPVSVHGDTRGAMAMSFEGCANWRRRRGQRRCAKPLIRKKSSDSLFCLRTNKPDVPSRVEAARREGKSMELYGKASLSDMSTREGGRGMIE
jgi:hypothetical protein